MQRAAGVMFFQGKFAVGHGGASPQRLVARDLASTHGSVTGDMTSTTFREEPLRSSPSSKLSSLATDIDELETKCGFLEHRNEWLTGRLLKSQQRFIERTLMGNSKVLLHRYLEAWRDVLKELLLERQLDEQTSTLDRCQHVAKELGIALAQEQDARRASEVAYRSLQDHLRQVREHERRLRQKYEDQQAELELLERRVHEAESCLARSRADAQAVIESANAYDRRQREKELEEREAKEERSNRRPGNMGPLEYSLKLREEAQGIVDKVSVLLPIEVRRSSSPEREP